jgi:hypothetical protein
VEPVIGHDDARAARRRDRLRHAGRVGVARLTGGVRSLFETGGRGFRNLAITQVFSTATDTLVAIGLAGTLFFTVPSAEARTNVAWYLLLTVAPFAVIGPTLGRILDRTPVATRGLLVGAAAGRALFAVVLLGRSDTWVLYPAAFMLLVLSRVHGITRNSLLPLALDEPRALVSANARIAWIGMLAGGLAAALGFAAMAVADVEGPLGLAAALAVLAAVTGLALPDPDASEIRHPTGDRAPRLMIPRRARLAQLATAGVRTCVGLLLLLMAFALHELDAGLLDFGALLGATGGGFAVASRVVPLLERRVREDAMVVGALSITAAAAFSAAQWFGLVAAAVTAAVAGFAWGSAKLAFDGLLQASVSPARRGAAFTRSETLFSIAFVVGAIVPTVLPMPVSLGLVLTGLTALAAQLVYVGALLVPPEDRRRPPGAPRSPPGR